jgi:hypothetical protein
MPGPCPGKLEPESYLIIIQLGFVFFALLRRLGIEM